MNTKNVCFSTKRFLLTLLVPFALLLTGFQASGQAELVLPTDQPSIDAGAKLFKMNCKSCHKIDRPATGPALKGVTQRQSLSWLMTWIKNPEAVIKSGDAHAVEMYEEYGNLMTAFPTLKDSDKLNILAYIEAWEPPPPPDKPKDPDFSVLEFPEQKKQ